MTNAVFDITEVSEQDKQFKKGKKHIACVRYKATLNKRPVQTRTVVLKAQYPPVSRVARLKAVPTILKASISSAEPSDTAWRPVRPRGNTVPHLYGFERTSG